MNGPKREDFSVVRLDEDRTAISFELLPVELPLEYARLEEPGGHDNIGLVCADWQPGEQYQITMAKKSIVVTIGASPFVSGQCEIDVWDNNVGDVETMTLRGSCRVRFTAHRLGVEIAGEAVDPWADALLYLTIVDGNVVWRPTPSLCSYVPLGTSWVGPSRELLFAARDTAPEHSGAYQVLPKGEHSVTMIAWLPGVWQVSAKRKIMLGNG